MAQLRQAQGWSADKAMVDRSPLNLVSRSLFNPTMGYATYIVPGVLILILQQTMLKSVKNGSGCGVYRSCTIYRFPDKYLSYKGHGTPCSYGFTRKVHYLECYIYLVLRSFCPPKQKWGHTPK